MDILPIAYKPVKNSYNNIVRIRNSKIVKLKIKGIRYLKNN